MELATTDAESTAWQTTARRVLDIEQSAIGKVRDAIDSSFTQAIALLRQLRGKVVCSGVGKSGHIASKIAATFSSTGTPSFFMHPTDAGHGDLGMISEADAALLLSYSGESQELLNLVPPIKRLQVPIIAIVGNVQSSLAKAADFCLSAAVECEACPHNLAPTASTTATLALGDALAMTLLQARGFAPEDFARTHPSGNLGRRLLLRVDDIMHRRQDTPLVSINASFSEVLIEMTEKKMGMTLLCNTDGTLSGIFTDGDLRRTVDKVANIHDLRISEWMTQTPQAISPKALAVDALNLMKEKKINHLAVVDGDQIIGALSFHDLLHHRLL